MPSFSIWASDEDLDKIKKEAEGISRSVSWYLIDCHRKSLSEKVRSFGRVGAIPSDARAVEQPIEKASEIHKVPDVESPETDAAVPTEPEVKPEPEESEEPGTIYDPGEIADTPSSVPEVEKPVSENPGKKAAVTKLQADIDGAASKWGNAGKDFSKGTQANRGKGKKKGGL